LKYSFNYNNIPYITDNSDECDEKTAFLLTEQNEKYLQSAKQKNCALIISPVELQKIFDISSMKIIGVTGTNGKTTTAAAIYSLLLDLGENVGFQGTRGFFVNDEKLEGKTLTTPSILGTLYHLKQAKDAGADFFVMEVSSHAIAQNRIESLQFALKVFTNITQDHLDYHGTFEEYWRVKSSFFSDDSKKLINKDAKKIDFKIKNTYTYALDVPASFNITAYSLNNGITAAIKHFDQQESFSSPLYGFFNLYNITAAIGSVKLVTDYSLKEICEVVENFAGVSGRMEVVSDRPLIIVDFAHTPDGMDKVLDSLKEKKLSVVFGAGGNRDRTKRVQMGRVANRYGKKIYLTIDNPRDEDPLDIIEDIYEGISKKDIVRIEPDRKKAIALAIDELEEEDVLLILGKGDEEFIEIGAEKIPFDDRAIVREIVKEKFNRY
jgi:UDP-N-acetylmuramoyl-L-alanyl-D-glutamate--2,6-diaminopimelate ligase